MPDKPADTTVAQQVELAIRRLDSLSILPCVVTRFLSQLNQFQLYPSSLAELIESDPALSAKILALIHEQGQGGAGGTLSFRQALENLPLRMVRDAVLSAKLYQAFDQNEQRVRFRKELILHALAVACCAKEISKTVCPEKDPQLAYIAGLLHNIGNLALDEVMPRSFATIIEEAESRNLGICTVQQKHLGLDYTVLGKRLAEKWHLPREVTFAIWLHQSDTTTISQSMPEAGAAQIVQLADSIARQCGIGRSGSYDRPDLPDAVAQSLAITVEQLQQIRRNLAAQVAQKSKVLGLDLPNAVDTYCDAIH